MPFKIRDAKLSNALALSNWMCELGYETTSAEMRGFLRDFDGATDSLSLYRFQKLTDQRYAASIDVIADARTEPES